MPALTRVEAGVQRIPEIQGEDRSTVGKKMEVFVGILKAIREHLSDQHARSDVLEI